MNILLNNKPEKLFDGSTVKKLLENKNIKNKYYEKTKIKIKCHLHLMNLP